MSPGSFSNYASVVTEYGEINYTGLDINSVCGVRPVLNLAHLDGLSLEIGDYVKLLNRSWVAISPTSVLASTNIIFHRFDNKSNNYVISEIKEYIEKWLSELLKSADQ